MAHDPEKYYEILGLKPGASIKEVKDAFTKQQLRYHPDGKMFKIAAKSCKTDEERQKLKAEYEEKSKKLNVAKTVLCDEKKKQAYDSGVSDFNGAGFGGAGADIFDIFSQMTGGSRRNQVRKVKDTVHAVSLSFKEAFMGKNVAFNVKVQRECTTCSGKGGDQVQTCDKCNGKGKVEMHRRLGPLISVHEAPCDKCNETGRIVKGKICAVCKGQQYVQVQEKIDLRIEPGVTNGKQYVFTGKGNHKAGHVPGDIIISVSIQKDHNFRRSGNNIISKIDVPLYTALVGGFVYFDHLDGCKLEIYIKPFTNLKKCILVRGEGFKATGSSRTGDLYLDPTIKIDNNIDKDLLAKALKHMPTQKPQGTSVGKQSEFATLPAEEVHGNEQYYESEGGEEYFGGASDFFSRMRFF